MKKKIICTVLATTMLLSQTASAAPWQMRRNQLIFDSEIGFIGNVTLTFSSDGGSFIRPIGMLFLQLSQERFGARYRRLYG